MSDKTKRSKPKPNYVCPYKVGDYVMQQVGPSWGRSDQLARVISVSPSGSTITVRASGTATEHRRRRSYDGSDHDFGVRRPSAFEIEHHEWLAEWRRLKKVAAYDSIHNNLHSRVMINEIELLVSRHDDRDLVEVIADIDQTIADLQAVKDLLRRRPKKDAEALAP